MLISYIEEIFIMTLGDKIRKYRTLKGLTQAQLGSMVKLTGDRIRQYENDVRKPKEGKLMEIAEALNINPTALFEPDYCNPNSVMHTLFELEDIYGLRFEKVGKSYQLVFSKGDDCQNSNWLIEGIAAWAAKRKELQPDINDSAEAITDKKEKYALWKARYPYDFRENIQKHYTLMNDFHKNVLSLLSQNRKGITTFSEFFHSLLALDTENVMFHIDIGKMEGKRNAIFTINLDYIMHADVSMQKIYMNFHECWHDMKKIGIEIVENLVPVDGMMYIGISTPCLQIIVLFEEYKKLQKEKASPLFDEDVFKMEIEYIMQLFNVPIEEYVQQ